jgi:hypothetical protein
VSDEYENFLELRVRIPFDAMYKAGLIKGYHLLGRARSSAQSALKPRSRASTLSGSSACLYAIRYSWPTHSTAASSTT